jgi:hypothetical protein
MEIRKDKFLASLLAFGLIGAAACGGSSEEGTEAGGTDMTTGGDTMAEPMDTTGMDEPMDEPADTGMDEGGDMGGDEGGDIEPSPE